MSGTRLRVAAGTRVPGLSQIEWALRFDAVPTLDLSRPAPW
jgi:hypothetical protein